MKNQGLKIFLLASFFLLPSAWTFATSTHLYKMSSLSSSSLHVDSLLISDFEPQNLIADDELEAEERRRHKSSSIFGADAFDSLLLVSRQKDSLKQTNKSSKIEFDYNKLLLPLTEKDSLLFYANPMFIDLVLERFPLDLNFPLDYNFQKMYYGHYPTSLEQNVTKPLHLISGDSLVYQFRQNARNYIARTAPELYVLNYTELPDPEGNKSKRLQEANMNEYAFVIEEESLLNKKGPFLIEKPKESFWQAKASSMLQFSESVVSKKWYQGGNSNIAILGILSGVLNYNDKNRVQWENAADWRAGFNSIESDVPHRIMQTNDDLFRITSKLGVKASGQWYYSSYFEFSTQFFSTYKGVNSLDRKTAFLTPIRCNTGLGLDLKLKKVSMMISPFAYKYIYMHLTDHIDPNQFGIKKGETTLKSLGSSFRVNSSLTFFKDLTVDSRLSFYTDYQKVEIDLEVVGNYSINRFMSVRLLINPRYDNTVIETPGSKPVIQYKQFMSIGFAHKFK